MSSPTPPFLTSDGPARYCGTMSRGDERELVYATTDGVYLLAQRRQLVTTQTSAWSSIEQVVWVSVRRDARLVDTEARLVDLLLEDGRPVAPLVEAWRQVRALRSESRELVLGPGDWVRVDLTSGAPS